MSERHRATQEQVNTVYYQVLADILHSACVRNSEVTGGHGRLKEEGS